MVLNSKHLRGLRRKAGAAEKGRRSGDTEKGECCESVDSQEGLGAKGGEGETRPSQKMRPNSASGGTGQQASAPQADRHPGGWSNINSDTNGHATNTNNGSSRAKAPGGRSFGDELPRGLGRVEYLPVEWHTRFKGRLYKEGGGGEGGSAGRSARTSSRSGVRASPGGPEDGSAGGGSGGGAGGGSAGLSIWDITLPRAPTLRAFTNDTLLDILYFMSPEYHQVRDDDGDAG